MNIELRFLQKAIEDKNYISFSYEKKNIKKIQPLKLVKKDDKYLLHTANTIFEFDKIVKLQILKNRF